MADNFFANGFSSFKFLLLPLVVFINGLWTADCSGQVHHSGMRHSGTPRYYPYTIARPQDREWIRNLPMERRPDRPLHFYGNLVRRNYSVQRPNYRAPRAVAQTVRTQGVRTFEIQPRP